MSARAPQPADEAGLSTGRPPSVPLLGIPLDPFTPHQLLDFLMAESADGRGGYLMTPNLDNLYSLTRDKVLRARALDADLRVADGMPLLWASRLRGTPLPARVAGSDLVFTLAERSATAGRSLFLLGGEPGVAERAATVLQTRYPGLNIVGTYFPPFGYEADPNELAQLTKAVVAAQPDFVYIGLPFPKASALALDLRQRLPKAWFVGVGISFSFITGEIVRAPKWMQAMGLEWIHRLIQEPRRLGRRYLIQGLPLAVRLLLVSFAERFER